MKLIATLLLIKIFTCVHSQEQHESSTKKAAATRSRDLINQCILYKYANIVKYHGYFLDASEFLIEKDDGKMYFFRFIDVYEKKINTTSCQKLKSYSWMKLIDIKKKMNKECYKTKNKIRGPTRIYPELDVIESSLPFEANLTANSTETYSYKLKYEQNSSYCDEIDSDSFDIVKANGYLVNYTIWAVEDSDSKNKMIFLRYLQIYNKSNDSIHIEEYCFMKEFQRNTQLNKKCYKTISYKSDQEFSDFSLLYEQNFTFNQIECKKHNLILTQNKTYCESRDIEYLNMNLMKAILGKTNLWNYFALNTLIVIIGCFTNLISLIVFIHAGYKKPKMGSRKSFMLFAISNIIFLVSMWFLSILPPGARVDTFNRLHNKVFSYLICKKLFYINLSSFFLSELIIVSLSFHRVLAVFFPFKVININSNYPRLFNILFFIVMATALLLPSLYLYFNQAIDIRTVPNIAEKTNLNEYCYVGSDLIG